MQLFRSEEHAAAHGACPSPELVPVRQAFELGKVWYANRLDEEYQPWTLAEAGAHFTAVGLTGAFWSS